MVKSDSIAVWNAGNQSNLCLSHVFEFASVTLLEGYILVIDQLRRLKGSMIREIN